MSTRLIIAYLCCWGMGVVAAQPADTALARRIEVLGEQAFENGKYDSAIHYFDRAASLFTHANQLDGRIRCMNEAGDIRTIKGDFTGGMDTLAHALTLSMQFLGRNHEQTSVAHNYLGSGYARMGEMDLSRKHFLEALSIRKEIFGEVHSSTAGAYINTGITYDEEGLYAKAIECYQKGIEIMRELGKEIHPFTANAYQNIGGCYRILGDYDLATASFKHALEIKYEAYPPNHFSFADTYTSLGNSYHDRGDIEQALEQYDKAEQIFSTTLGLNHPRYAVMLRNKAFTLYDDNRYEEAMLAYQRSLDITRQNLGADHPKVADILNSLGEVYAAQNPEYAISLYQDAAEILVDKGMVYSETYGTVLHNLSYMYRKQGKLQEARKYLDEAFYAMAPGFLEPLQSPYALLNQPIHKNNLLAVIREKGRYHLSCYELRGKALPQLDSALLAFDLASALIDSSRISVGGMSRDAKQILSGKSQQIYEQGLETALRLHTLTGDRRYLEYAYKFMERNKFLTLYESMRETQARQFAGIPDSLLSLESDLRQQIAHYEQLAFETRQADKSDTGTLRRLEGKVANFRERYREIRLQLEREFPEYYRMRYNVTSASPQALADWVAEDQMLVEYFMGERKIYIARFSAGSYHIFSVDRSPALDEAIASVRRGVADRKRYLQDPATADQQYRNGAGRLYQDLLKEAFAGIKHEINELILIPDGQLGHLPFEILLTEPDTGADYQELPYLLRRHWISYAYSGTLILAESESGLNRQAKKLFAGFAANYPEKAYTKRDSSAPGYTLLAQLERSGELPLPGAVREVSDIAALLDGDAFMGEFSSEAAFKQRASEYAVIHLAMHALTEDENPLYSRLLFTPDADSLEDGFLYASELYNMQLNAQLAVLSACNTGYGKLQEGEGPMSLSRAFAYAGCPSLVMSLWRVPDQATSEIMVSFYEGLHTGKAKDEALRDAKLAYLNAVTAPELAHPYYWAGFVPSGNMEPVDIQESVVETWLGALLILLLSGLLIWWYRKR